MPLLLKIIFYFFNLNSEALFSGNFINNLMVGVFTLLGAIIGSIITYFVLNKLENKKKDEIRVNCAGSLLLEVRRNKVQKKKIFDLLVREKERNGTIKNINVFELFKNNFSIFNNILRSNVAFKNKKIKRIYSDYLLVEESSTIMLDKNLKTYFKLNASERKIVTTDLKHSFKTYFNISKVQLERIEKVYNYLINEAGLTKEEISDLNLDKMS